jgi:hypothetical protein
VVKQKQNLTEIQKALDAAENQIRIARIALEQILTPEKETEEVVGQEILGKFDGENMIGDDRKKYPIPANYASKSKLVEGDGLKLTIASDGTFIYKQIEPIERKNLIGELIEEEGIYKVKVDKNKYNVLLASVTYFKAKPGDQVTIIVPKDAKSHWAAVESVLS